MFLRDSKFLLNQFQLIPLLFPFFLSSRYKSAEKKQEEGRARLTRCEGGAVCWREGGKPHWQCDRFQAPCRYRKRSSWLARSPLSVGPWALLSCARELIQTGRKISVKKKKKMNLSAKSQLLCNRLQFRLSWLRWDTALSSPKLPSNMCWNWTLSAPYKSASGKVSSLARLLTQL